MTDTDIGAATTRLAAAAEALEQTIARISASHDSLHAKVDRIIAAIDDRALAASTEKMEDLERRIATLERENAELKFAATPQNVALASTPAVAGASSPAHDGDDACTLSRAHASDSVGVAAAAQRKTLAPFVSMLLTKSGVDDPSADSAVLDKALTSLSLEQRVAVKAEMARAGLIA